MQSYLYCYFYSFYKMCNEQNLVYLPVDTLYLLELKG